MISENVVYFPHLLTAHRPSCRANAASNRDRERRPWFKPADIEPKIGRRTVTEGRKEREEEGREMGVKEDINVRRWRTSMWVSD